MHSTNSGEEVSNTSTMTPVASSSSSSSSEAPIPSSQRKSSSRNDDRLEAIMYNSYVASAVEISQPQILQVQPSLILSFIRSARDIDTNTKRKFVYNFVWNPPSNDEVSVTTATDSAVAKSNAATFLPPIHLAPNVMARIPSPSGDKIAVWMTESRRRGGGGDVGTASNGMGSMEQVVEIWTHGGMTLERKIVLPKTLHGDVCTDSSWFGSIQWNKQETALVYSAERNAPCTASYFDPSGNSLAVGGGDDNDKSVVVGGTNVLGIGIGENWGEKYTKTCLLDLFIVHAETGKVARVENVPPGVREHAEVSKPSTDGGYLLGQARFSPNGKHIVYTAWDAGEGGYMPKRLGSIYCYQRHCALYQSPVERLMERLQKHDSLDEQQMEQDSEFTCLTPNDRLARSPRFCVVEGKRMKLFWLSHSQGFDTHGGVMGLSCMEWNDTNGADLDSKKDIVKPVDVPVSDNSDDAFPGLFLNQLPEENFVSKDGKFLFVTSQWRSVSKILRISISTGEVMPLRFDLNAESKRTATSASQNLLCMTDQGDAIVTQSEPFSPPVIGFIPSSSLTENQDQCVASSFISNLGPISATSSVGWKTMSNDEKCCGYHLVRVHPPHGEIRAPVEGILLLPSKSKTSRVPLIVVPHGGPHSCTSTSYLPSYAYLSEAGGYAILHVNYRGSSGFGQTALESLAGNAGTQDVLDCKFLTSHVLTEFSDFLDGERVGVCGGSHGGFLSAHLIGQFPELFKVAAMRNPVTNIATMTTSTDIPDWCYVESLGIGSYDWTKFRGPTSEDLRIMWEASPIAHISNVKAPTLVALGNSDKRVPPSQGMEYYYALRSKGVDTKLLIYQEDDHAIDKVQSEADHWINIKKWFDKYL